MADEIMDEDYEYPEDVLVIGESKFVGVRTLILAIIALLGYIFALYLPALTGTSIDVGGLYNLTAMGFAFFFVKTIIPVLKE